MYAPRTSPVFLRILYYRPDRPALLQRYEQVFPDLVPDIPRVHRLLLYWQRHIRGTINQVMVDVGDGNLKEMGIRTPGLILTIH